MKTLVKISLTIAFSLLVSNSFAQTSVTATANIITAIAVNPQAGAAGQLNFGDMLSPAGLATVNVAATLVNTRTVASGTITLVGTAYNAAAIDITGATGANVDITVDPNVTITSGANNMTATLASSAATATLTGGAATFYVGGTLSVGAAQATGNYTGTFNVTVAYQ